MTPLSGELSFATADAVLQQAQATLSGSTGPVELDLAGVTRTDSAGLALLLELTRLARAREQQIRFVHAPEQLRKLAEFFGLAELLALTA